MVLPRFPSIGVQLGCLDGIDERPYVGLCDLRVGQNVPALLVEDAGDAVTGGGWVVSRHRYSRGGRLTVSCSAAAMPLAPRAR